MAVGAEPYLAINDWDMAWWELGLVNIYFVLAYAGSAMIGLLLGLEYLGCRVLLHYI